MTPLAIVFMALSWGLVLGLTIWSFGRVFRAQRDGKRRGQEPPNQESPGPYPPGP